MPQTLATANNSLLGLGVVSYQYYAHLTYLTHSEHITVLMEVLCSIIQIVAAGNRNLAQGALFQNLPYQIMTDP
jgi:hypothetical protein